MRNNFGCEGAVWFAVSLLANDMEICLFFSRKNKTVTLPDGVKAGDTIHVQAPSGKTNAIVIPAGFGPGSTFTVEFADDTPAPPAKNTNDDTFTKTGAPTAPPPPASNLPDDGFATGFGNPQYRPTATAVQEPEVHVSSSSAAYGNYPSAAATPVYTPQFSPPPSYPSK